MTRAQRILLSCILVGLLTAGSLILAGCTSPPDGTCEPLHVGQPIRSGRMDGVVTWTGYRVSGEGVAGVIWQGAGQVQMSCRALVDLVELPE